jgi:hypothetical protein
LEKSKLIVALALLACAAGDPSLTMSHKHDLFTWAAASTQGDWVLRILVNIVLF